MKLFKLSSCMLLCALSLTANADDVAGFSRYENANKQLVSEPNTGTRVVFIGNSITDFWASSRPEFFSANDFIGRGISGQTTYQFLMRFREDVINLKPAAVVINGGTNDVAENMYPYNSDRTFGNIISMVELAQANNVKVILASVLPASGFNWNTSIKDAADKIAALNARIKEYATANEIPYVDYYSEMVYGDNRALNPEYTADGVHPNDVGYEVMESIVIPVVRQVVKLDVTVPESVVLEGDAIADGEPITCTKVSVSKFEAFTGLNGGKSFKIKGNDGTTYTIVNSGLTEGSGAVRVENDGVYCVSLDFVSRVATVKPVNSVSLFYCIANEKVAELDYEGNGQWKGYWTCQFLDYGWGEDTRYRLVMNIDGQEQCWGPLNDNEDGDPNGTDEYYYMKRTYPADQWSNKWKFPHDFNGKNLEITVTMRGIYTHYVGESTQSVVVPSALTVTGEALAESQSFAMSKVDDYTFELFTRLTGGKTFSISNGSKVYTVSNGKVQEGSAAVQVAADGVYCINLNFLSGNAYVRPVNSFGIYYCWFGSNVVEMDYLGNGEWSGTFGWYLADDRYRLQMNLDGETVSWGPLDGTLDTAPDGTAEYFYMRRTTPVDQWANKWKFDSSLAGKNVKVTAKMHGTYTHTVEEGSGSALSIPSVSQEGSFIDVNGNEVAFGADSKVYNLSGALVASPRKGEKIVLQQGVYVAACAGSISKFVIN